MKRRAPLSAGCQSWAAAKEAFAVFGMMALWLLVPLGIVWWVLDQNRTRSATGYGPQSARPATEDGARGALGILEERFARGEIDAEEFRTRREAILGSAAHVPTPEQAVAQSSERR